jgi:hypothetical protein
MKPRSEKGGGESQEKRQAGHSGILQKVCDRFGKDAELVKVRNQLRAYPP